MPTLECAMWLQTHGNPAQTSTSSHTAGYLIWAVVAVVVAFVVLMFIRATMGCSPKR